MEDFLREMPKVELHCHLEGTLEPTLLLRLAERNDILHTLRFQTVQDWKHAYNFEDLQSFLDLYYECMHVLRTERDFYDLTWEYMLRVSNKREHNVRHCEVSFDPQPHMDRGVDFDTIIHGIHRALQDGQHQLAITSRLIMCFVRHLSANSAMKTLHRALKHKDKIVAVGLDSTERGNPPEKFTEVFQLAVKEGFATVAHAGEEGPPSYVWAALQALRVDRIDHGVRSTEDPQLMEYLRNNQIPLTVCPLSNVRLCVFDSINQHCIKQMLDYGLRVTVNSDDPAYFGGYITDNFLALYDSSLGLTKEDFIQIGRNAIEASFLTMKEKDKLNKELDLFVMRHGRCDELTNGFSHRGNSAQLENGN